MSETDSGSAADSDSDGEPEQCRALTGDGERCSRPAQEDGFCHQHDEGDPTVDEKEADGDGDNGDNDADADESGSESESDGDGSSASEGDTSSSEDDDIAAAPGLIEIRNEVRKNAASLIGHKFDAIVGIDSTDDGWIANVELVERRSIPDTEDILGRYEIEIDEAGRFQSYRRVDRYRRSDTDTEDF